MLKSILEGILAGLSIAAMLVMAIAFAIVGPQVVYDFCVNHPILALLMVSSVLSSSIATTGQSK